MWILFLVFNVLVLFAFYKVFSNRIVKNSSLQDVVKKYRNEIDAIVKNFNQASYDNITLLEEKIDEAKNLLKYLNLQKKELENMKGAPNVVTKEIVNKKVKSLKKKNKLSKAEQVLMHFNEGTSVKVIAQKLDISENEVKLYIREM